MNSHAFSRKEFEDSCRDFPTAHVPFPASISTSAEARNGSYWNDATPASANFNRLLDRQEAATYLRLKPQTLANWAVTRAQDLPYVKIGRRVMYRLADLDAFVMANRHGNRAVVGGANV
ncbi:helix-turn-helix domain-containing protein [Paraburkholderia sp. MM6662-R1]|uniref:helix-turn-helix domain-containing protein n=1 Tax=Paraburkholderia sp. MM6662-R1 TaxID=2991066 RepID=UPI003D2136E2